MQFFRTSLLLAALAFGAAACETPPQPAEDSPEFTPGAGEVAAGIGHGVSENSRIQIGYALAPVPLDLKGKNPALVGLGSYLVHTHACSDCHTNPPFAAGGNPFLGEPEQTNTENYLAGGTPFGPFTSRNITPEPSTGLPAGFTLEEFIHVMRTGEDLHNQHPQISPLLQVMPWPFFKDLTDRELHAIYEYLRAIPSAEPAG
ncbi:MAG: cytochrome C [Gemmatimonadetes bacterium]|uniref:Cytochrome C n=1 Tax=Candidatus Kutchimonas denitrificans TaxID=3056748 RepID=A0AAE5CAF7_9BACT|nr:cytochrome C [Gemmatimonadota bacterium]NIR76456.1 cytochrome C [Candidatus Kutchimonas denitrificans]NIS03274.1 cytochrome C [Gemmatimonadota bacterium]NIT69135.1 cytochrome C [Gemmatimonadota bacterium]NIU54527.1 cytochrome C [Gemmatimonadota bacterium]